MTAPIQAHRIPPYGRALLEILNFENPCGARLQQLGVEEWRKLLQRCDASQLTLLLGHLGRAFLPAWVEARIHLDFANNALRFERVKAAVFEIAESLTTNSIEFVLLKGFTHSPLFTPDPLLRAQGDIDIWCRPEAVSRARDALIKLGYRHFGKTKGRHLDPMIRESHWTWTGDYFAPELPIPVDLHYELWDSSFERLPGPNEYEMWERRCPSLLDGRIVTGLDPADLLAFAALHLMMHLFHGDLRLQRAWEIAWFLQHHSRDHAFWSRWQSLYSAGTRRVQVVAFLLTSHWFGCRLPGSISGEIDALPGDIRLWISRYRFSPVESLFLPNKDELWLNLALVPSFGDKARVAARRLFPVHAAIARDPARTSFFAGRAGHHITLLPITFLQGIKWWWMRQQLGPRRWIQSVFSFFRFVR